MRHSSSLVAHYLVKPRDQIFAKVICSNIFDQIFVLLFFIKFFFPHQMLAFQKL